MMSQKLEETFPESGSKENELDAHKYLVMVGRMD